MILACEAELIDELLGVLTDASRMLPSCCADTLAGSLLPFSHAVLVERSALSVLMAHAMTSHTPQRQHRQQTSIESYLCCR